MSRSIAIVSPHQDDAVFSLAECVRRLVAGGVHVHVVNCFTRSEHAPYRAPHDRRPASVIRAAEDRAALAAIGVEHVTDLGHLDAPLRLGVSVADVCTDRAFDDADEAEARRLATAIGGIAASDLVLAPLAGPGAHVDHRLARHAAMLAAADRLAFYEDLPYVTRVPATAVLDAADAAARDVGEPLVPYAVRPADGGCGKRAAAMLYASQITERDVDDLDCDGQERGYAERLWLAPSRAAWLAPIVDG